MELEIWKGDWGLASIDLQCLKVYAYLKFLGAPVKFHEKTNPFLTVGGSYPVLRDGRHVLTSFPQMVEHLKTQNYDADLHLSREQLLASMAWEKHLELHLLPCLWYVWWMEGEELRGWYMRHIPFPLNYYYTSRYQSKATDMITCFYGPEADPKEVCLNVYNTFDIVMGELSARLGDNEFMFGSRPSTLDATVFSYLALSLKVPHKNSTLLNRLKAHDRLVQYAVRVSQRYFTTTHPEFISGVTRMVVPKEDKSLVSRHTMERVYAGLFAVVAMLGFAFSKGIFQFSFKDEFDEMNMNEEDYDYYDGDDDDS